MPDVATDGRSTCLLLRVKKHVYADDQDFHIVQAALSQLSGNVDKRQLHRMTTDPPRTAKTVRQYFKERSFGAVSFTVPNSPDQATSAQEQKEDRAHYRHSHEWRKYYVKLVVLAQARRWLSSTEQLQPIADAPPTPKTNFQLADAIKHSAKAEYVPFGVDFEDADAYSPVITRLLAYAEIDNDSDNGYH